MTLLFGVSKNRVSIGYLRENSVLKLIYPHITIIPQLISVVDPGFMKRVGGEKLLERSMRVLKVQYLRKRSGDIPSGLNFFFKFKC